MKGRGHGDRREKNVKKCHVFVVYNRNASPRKIRGHQTLFWNEVFRSH